MKRPFLALAVFLTAASLHAQSAEMARLKDYVSRTLPRCPGAAVAFDPVAARGPAGFQAYRAVLTSADEHCSASKFLLYSPLTGQTLIGSVIAIPGGEQPVHVRLAEHTSKILNAPITVQIAPLALPDGLKQVLLIRRTEYGPFTYTTFLDSSERFLVVGLRGTIDEDPAHTLRKAIGVEAAARRGNGAAKIEIVEISDFQCPTCARAHHTLEPLFASNLRKIRYSRIDLPLFDNHKWALPAALGSRAIQQVAPAKYWDYVNHVFRNQEVLDESKFDRFFQNWVEDNDLSWPAVAKVYRSESEKKAVLDSVSRLFGAGISSTPTFIVNGQPLGFGNGAFAVDFLKKTLGVK
ncbi:MAG TPA: thioredoxin domain-containing protein [Thermoanaerobaculia bacterium]|nr:thioredoxin domain-containing protein [Thermoanaerobaculia bacterium]